MSETIAKPESDAVLVDRERRRVVLCMGERGAVEMTAAQTRHLIELLANSADMLEALGDA